MKFLHVSDLHLGKRLHRRALDEDQSAILDQILDLAAREDVDAVLVAGDVYNRTQPQPECISMFSRFLSRLRALGKPAFFVRGNHDGEAQLAYASELLSEGGLHLTGLFDGTLSRTTLTDEFGELDVWLMPYIRPTQAHRVFPDEKIESYADAVRAVLERAQIDPSRRNVLVTHQYVFGAQPSDSEDRALGGLDQIPAEAFDAFDYVALGHLHRAQTLRGGKIRYCGAPLVYSFDECAQEKSATLVTVGEKGAPNEFEFVPFRPLRRCVRLEGTLAELCAMPRSEDYLQAMLTDELRPLDALGTLQVTWPNVLNLQFLHLTGEEIDAAQEEADRGAMGPLEHFAAFYAHQNGRAPTEAQLDVIREILREGGENL